MANVTEESINLAVTRAKARLASGKIGVSGSARAGNSLTNLDVTKSARDILTDELSGLFKDASAPVKPDSVADMTEKFIVPFSWTSVGTNSVFEDFKKGPAGVMGGMAAGALIGSVVPVIGTAVGGIIGGGIGALTGYSSNKKKSDSHSASMIESYFDAVSLSLETERSAIIEAAKKACSNA